MWIKIKKAQAEAIGVKALEKFTQNDRWGFRDEVSISLVGMDTARLDQLEAMITKAAWEVMKDDTRKADDQAFFLKVRDITAAAFDPSIFAAAIAQIKDAGADPIRSTDLPAVVEVATKRLALPDGTRGSILNHLARGGDLSRWGLSSAITATANEYPDYEGATDLERAGGEVLALQGGAWDVISKAEKIAA